MDYLVYSSPDELIHYGIKGMHWGIRRYQPYPDGNTGGKFIGKRKHIQKRNAKNKKSNDIANIKRQTYIQSYNSANKKLQSISDDIINLKLKNLSDVYNHIIKNYTFTPKEEKRIKVMYNRSKGTISGALLYTHDAIRKYKE